MATLDEPLLQHLRRLPPADLEAVHDFVRVLLQQPEVLTPEERVEVEAGEAEIARGEYVRWEDVRRTKCLPSG